MKMAFVGGFGFKPKGTIQGRAYPMAVELVRQGHEVTIFVTPYDNLDESGREWVQEGVHVKGVKAGATAYSIAMIGKVGAALTTSSLTRGF
jgi:hypothetical protein